MASNVATIEPRAQVPAVGEVAHFELMQRKAALFAASPLIPESLRAGGPQQALANCYIGLQMAEAMQENALTVLQNIHVVKGKAGFSAQFMIARANASGIFKDGIDWRVEGKGDSLSVTAFGTLAATGREVSFTADMAMAKAEGWTSNSKYRSMPELMLRYRSGTFLVRLYAPQVMFGYQTVEEVEDVVFSASPAPAPEGAVEGRALLAASLGPDDEDDAEPIGEDQDDITDTAAVEEAAGVEPESGAEEAAASASGGALFEPSPWEAAGIRCETRIKEVASAADLAALRKDKAFLSDLKAVEASSESLHSALLAGLERLKAQYEGAAA